MPVPILVAIGTQALEAFAVSAAQEAGKDLGLAIAHGIARILGLDQGGSAFTREDLTAAFEHYLTEVKAAIHFEFEQNRYHDSLELLQSAKAQFGQYMQSGQVDQALWANAYQDCEQALSKANTLLYTSEKYLWLYSSAVLLKTLVLGVRANAFLDTTNIKYLVDYISSELGVITAASANVVNEITSRAGVVQEGFFSGGGGMGPNGISYGYYVTWTGPLGYQIGYPTPTDRDGNPVLIKNAINELNQERSNWINAQTNSTLEASNLIKAALQAQVLALSQRI